MTASTQQQRRVKQALAALTRDGLRQHLEGLRRSRLRMVEYHVAGGSVSVLRADAIAICQKLQQEPRA
jgi:hypothetical protein